jgi:hypothetical protein
MSRAVLYEGHVAGSGNGFVRLGLGRHVGHHLVNHTLYHLERALERTKHHTKGQNHGQEQQPLQHHVEFKLFHGYLEQRDSGGKSKNYGWVLIGDNWPLS